MNKFKVGDRVAVYSGSGRSTGVVMEIHSLNIILYRPILKNPAIWYDTAKSFFVHEKQCRKLKPKKSAEKELKELKHRHRKALFLKHFMARHFIFPHFNAFSFARSLDF